MRSASFSKQSAYNIARPLSLLRFKVGAWPGIDPMYRGRCLPMWSFTTNAATTSSSSSKDESSDEEVKLWKNTRPHYPRYLVSKVSNTLRSWWRHSREEHLWFPSQAADKVVIGGRRLCSACRMVLGSMGVADSHSFPGNGCSDKEPQTMAKAPPKCGCWAAMVRG